MKRMKRCMVEMGLLWVLLCAALWPQTAVASKNGEAALTLDYIHPGVNFTIYQVATSSGTGYTATKEFARYSVSFNISTASEWRALASTLTAYTARDNLTPMAGGITNSRGQVAFANLGGGLYLVVGDPYTKGNDTDIPIPFLVDLSNSRAVTAEVKYDRITDGDSSEMESYADYTVEKVWQDEGHAQERPASVTVQLLKDGAVYGTAVLNESSGWQHTWRQLNIRYNWQITETEVPKGYTVTVTQNQGGFTVTNTYEATKPDPEREESGGEEESPKTGDTNQIIQYMALAGGSLLILGLHRLTKGREVK